VTSSPGGNTQVQSLGMGGDDAEGTLPIRLHTRHCFFVFFSCMDWIFGQLRKEIGWLSLFNQLMLFLGVLHCLDGRSSERAWT